MYNQAVKRHMVVNCLLLGLVPSRSTKKGAWERGYLLLELSYRDTKTNILSYLLKMFVLLLLSHIQGVLEKSCMKIYFMRPALKRGQQSLHDL